MKQIKTYEQYKDSEIEWIGKIPKYWKIRRIKDIGNVETGNTPPKSNQENYEDGTFLWVKPDELKYLEPIIDTKEKLSEKGKNLSRIIPKNSILVCGIGTIGKIGIAGCELATNQQINSIILNKDINTNFGNYLILSTEQEQIKNSNKVVVPILNKTRLGNIKIPLPSNSEQKFIADFLDDKTKKIYLVLENKRKQIELLREYEKIVVNEAVMRGLDKKVILTDSIHPWIDKKNTRWKERKLQYMTYIKGRIGWQGLTTDEYLDSGEYYLITGTDFETEEIDWSKCNFIEKIRYDEDPHIQLQEQDVLITKDGSIGKIVQIRDLPKPATLNSGIMVTRPIKNDYIQRFFFWVLKSHAFNEFIEFNKTGSTIAHLYQKVFNNFYFPVPSLPEQQKIANYLDEKTSKIRKSIGIIEKEVEKLEEYKKILINEAVTGKIKVF